METLKERTGEKEKKRKREKDLSSCLS